MRDRLCAVLFAIATIAPGGIAPSTAYATISEALSLEALVQQADHVVLVTAQSERARRDSRDRIVTDFTVRVDEVMKGRASVGSTVVMTRLGGAIGDIGMRVEGEPHLEIGARYVLFLRTARDGRTLRPVGMSQGVMEVREQHGTPTVMPGGGGLALVQRVTGGQLVPAPAALIHPERYVTLRARLGQIIDGERRTVGP
jgi:hypothetical protein